MHRAPLVVVTGGPCGGKTTFLKHACRLLRDHGIRAIVIPEMATELFGAGFHPNLVGNNTFQRHILKCSIEREESYQRLALLLPGDMETVLLCDRGTLDGAAYVGRSEFTEIARGLGYSLPELRHRYLMVVHLVTAADGAEEHYTLANNAARSETAEEARALDTRTQEAWHGHPHQYIIDNRTDFGTKMYRAVRAFGRKLNMPQVVEREKKFLCNNFRPELIPKSAVPTDVVQTYLVPVGELVRRVRKVLQDGHATYTYTEKRPTGLPGENFENESKVTRSKYFKLLAEADPTRSPIVKCRYHFTHQNQHFELDVFDGSHRGLVMLEIELRDMSEKVILPEGWDLEEVTGDDTYSNFMLAQRAA